MSHQALRWQPLSCSLLVPGLLFALSVPARAQSPAASSPTWPPARTWVFCAGLLEWERSSQLASFPQANRRDEILLDVFKRRGVPEGQIKYLKDAQATTAAIEREFVDFLQKPAEGDWLFVYYCGHGFNTPDHQRTYLASYDAGGESPGWDVATVPSAIERHFRGSHAIITLDNCCSGAMAEAVQALQQPRVSYAVLASAHCNSVSTAHWTFTENLVYAFRGENFMDDDANGAVTFQELADNVFEDMTFAERQMPQFVFTGKFDKQTTIAAPGRPAEPDIGRRAEFLSGGRWYPGFTVARDGQRYKVRYYGYTEADDEWISAADQRRPERKTLPIGSKVEVIWNRQWYEAEVIALRAGLHLVKYDGWGPEWNEWVPIERMR